MFFLGLLIASIVLVSSEPPEPVLKRCDSDCYPSVRQCLRFWHQEPTIATDWDGATKLKLSRTGKRDTPAFTNDFDMPKQNTGILGVIVPEKTKDFSVRLPTKQQLQNMENYVLFDYLRDMQNE